MGKKKRAYTKKPFESSGVSSDTSANIFHSMMISAAFQSLTAPQQILYVWMKDQMYQQKRHPENNPEMFYFNRAIQRKYGIKNPTQFCKDRDALIEKGFIKVVESGANTRTKDIYKYSDMWRKYGTSEFKLEYNEMSASLARKKRKEQTNKPTSENKEQQDKITTKNAEKDLSPSILECVAQIEKLKKEKL